MVAAAVLDFSSRSRGIHNHCTRLEVVADGAERAIYILAWANAHYCAEWRALQTFSSLAGQDYAAERFGRWRDGLY